MEITTRVTRKTVDGNVINKITEITQFKFDAIPTEQEKIIIDFLYELETGNSIEVEIKPGFLSYMFKRTQFIVRKVSTLSIEKTTVT